MPTTVFTYPSPTTPQVQFCRWGGQNKAEVLAACAGKHGVSFCGEKYCVIVTWSDPNSPPRVSIAEVGEFIVLGIGDVLTRHQVNQDYPGTIPP